MNGAQEAVEKAIKERVVTTISPLKGGDNVVVVPIEIWNKQYDSSEIEEMLWIPCCHTSGMHDPVHFQERKYICNSQKAKALERFCRQIEINPVTISDPECGWCEEYPEKKKGEGLELLQCEHCDGTGEVSIDEDDGEGHIMRGVGTAKCICQKE